MRKPRFYDSVFGEKVREAFNKGELTWNNVDEWEIKYNSGRKPVPEFTTREIMKFYIKSGRKR